MNKIYRIIWNSALNAWVVVSELTRNHTKRASATVATAVLATLLSATAQASTGASDFDPPSTDFDPENPTFTDEFATSDESSNDTLKFGLLVVDKDGKLKDEEFKNASDDEQGKRAISVEVTESSTARPKLKSSYLYLRENGGIEIDQEGRSAKFKVKHGDGLKIDDDKLIADTVDLTVTNGKVGDVNGNDKKLVNAGNLTTTLNDLGWQLKTTNGTAAAGTNATSTVKSGDEVEFKGEGGVTVTSSTTDGKHTVTIKAAQSTNKGGAWKITAAKEDGGELDPANTAPTEQEVNTNDKVTLKAGDNLKIKQSGKDFTYSLKKELKNLTSVEFKDANGSTDSASTKIDKDGLTITPTNGAATGTTTPNAISVTTSGISAGSKEITNVKSALSKYNSSNNDAKKDLVDLSSLTNTATGGTTTNNGLANKAATVGDLAGLGWVLSSTKTTDEAADKPFHAAVKNANEVEFKGKGAATVSAKTDSNGKHTVTVDVKEVEAGNGLEKDTANGKIKLKVKAKDGEENLLTVGADGVSVTKGEFNTVETTTTTGHGGNANDRGKVTVKASANGGQATADDKKKVATVGDVADAINDAATFVKVESTTDDIEDGTANGNTADDQALKAGDTLTFKAGKNLKAKLDGKSVTFALAKNITTDSATLSEKLSIGKGADKVDITSDTNGLKLSKGTNGDTAVHLNGLASTLPDVTTNTGSSTSVTFSPSEIEKTRAATLKDVLNAGWNIKGAKVAGGITENVDLVAGYDNVEFITGDKNTLDVVLTAKDNGKTTEVKFTPKTSVIKEKDGKLVTGKKGAVTGTPNTTEDADEGTGLVTAKAVIDAVNKSGWRVSGEGTTAETGATAVTAGQAQTVTSGTSVNFKNGNATTATVSKDNGNINVKYDVNTGDGLKVDDKKITVNTGDGLKVEGGKVVASVGDGLKLDNQKIVADTTVLTVTDGKVTAPNGTNGDTKKLVDAGSLADALNKLSWKAKADKDTDGEVDPTTATEQEVKAGETVTFKAGKNLKVKQSEKDFTYSLKDELTGLTSIALGTAENGKTTTKITENGLTVSTTPANGGTATEVKIGSDGISAGNKAITNVASGLTTYGDNQNGGQTQPTEGSVEAVKKDLVDLTKPAIGAAGMNNGTDAKAADTTAATVGDLRKLGWVLSADKTTDNNSTAFHAAVKNAEEVEFKGTGKATVSAKTDTSTGKHTVTIDVAETKIEASDGIEKTNDGKLKLKVKTGNDNLLTVDTDGVSVTKGELEVASTDTTAGQGTNTADRGKVKVKGVNGTETENDKKKVATAVDVAKAINEAATFVKVQSSDEDIENDAATKDAADDQALKAGDTLTFKAGKNLKAKLDKTGKSVTFALAKSIETDSATLSKTLSIGENGNKVNITSDTKGLNFAKETAGTNGDTTVHLNGIGSTLHDTLSNTGVTTNLNGNGITDDEKKRAASVRDVLNVGWNIKGVKSNSATKQSENVDFVRTYDTVEFLSGSEETTTVTVDSEDNGKTTKVKIGAKTSVIKEHNGKLFTGKNNKNTNNVNSDTATDNADEGKGLVTAETVINAVNKAGWRIKTTAANGQDGFETVTSGTNVTFDNGNGTTATVTKDTASGAITVKYDVKAADGLKVDATKGIVADTTTLTVNGAAATGAVDNTTPKGKVKEITSENDKKKLVKAGDLVTALNSLSWTATAGAEDGGEKEGNATEQEVKAGDKVTFKAGDNLKIKQSGKDFTYSLKKELKDLTSIELKGAANGGNNGASTKIDQNGLTITPAVANGGTAKAEDTISVTKDGISVGGKTVNNVTSGLRAYDDKNFDLNNNSITDLNRHVEDAYKGLLNLNEKGADKQHFLVTDNTAATVGDLRKLGWVLSSKNGTTNEKSQQVKQADEVLFEGKGGAKVTSKSDNGKHTITIDVAETKVGDGLEKDTDGKIKVKAKDGADNLLTVDANGASVAKGSFADVNTNAPAQGQTADTNRGKVVVKASNGTVSEDDKKKVATVGDVAEAINSAATFVKVESTEDEINDADTADAGNNDALKAGDTLTLKAGKNLKVKRDGKDVTFALAKDLDVKTAKVSDTLTIGGNIPTDGGAATPKVNITSTAGGLNFENAIADATGSKNVYLKGIATTLTEPSAGAKSSHVDLNVDAAKKSNAASIEDVLRAGWNIKGAKTVGGAVDNVDFVSPYDTVEFVGGANANVILATDTAHKKTTVRVDVTGLPVQYVTEDDKTVVKVGNKYYEAKDDGSADMAKTVDTDKLAKTKVKLVSASGAGPVKITNVADGTEDTDAVSFKQLKALQDQKVTLTASNAYANGGADTDDGKATQTLSNGLNFKFKSADRELLKISADGDTVTFTPKEGSVQVGADGKATILNGANSTNGLVEAGKLVDSLNKLGWKVGTGTDGTGATEGTSNDTLVKSGDKVTLKAGDNLKVKQEGTNFTYALKDELTGVKSVEFKDAANGASTKITKDGLTFTPATGANGAAATDADKIKVASDGISAGNKAVKNVVSGLKKFNPANPIVGKDLDNITKNADDAYKGLTNLDEKDADKQTLAVADNTAATVGDLRGLGWVISADKTTGDSKEYHDQVRNANEVKFKSGNGISVSGKTLDNGTREITFELAKGEVTNKVSVTKKDNSTVEAVVIDGKYYERDENGKPKLDKEISSTDIKSTDNKGSGYVTGNQVADAIAKSGFELGLADAAEAEKAFAESAKDKRLSKDKAETVNANDKVRFADGKHTKVSAATVESIDANGEKVTTTFVKTDVELPLTQIYNTDANGKKITKVVENGQTKWYELKNDGSTDMDKEVTLGNVDSDGKKVVKDNDGKWYHAKADGTADTSTQAVDDSKVSTDEKHVVSLDPNNQSNGKGVVIDNVANGDISPNSKQAVNGSQIFALTGNKTPNITSITVDKDGKTVNVGTAGNANDTNKTYHNVVVGEDGKTPLLTTYNVEGRKEIITNSVVEAIYNMNEQGIKFFHSNDGKATSRIERSNEIDSSASGKFATAIGAKADAAGENAIAFGYGSKALRDNTVAIGTGNVVNAEKSGAFGDPNYIEDKAGGSYAFGNDNRITSKNTFVLGNGVNAKYKANGDVETETVTVKDKDGKNTTVTVPKALGATVENSVYLGNKSTATEKPGSNLKSDGTAGNTTSAGATGTVNGFAGATAHGAVSVGASGEERRIQNVAAGEISATSTDAINGSQLYAATKGIADQAVGMVRALKRELEGVAAGANAAAALPQSYLPGKSMISAATGAYGSTGALAVGYSSISDNGKWVVKGQLNVNTRSKAGGGVGVGYIW
ncbi:Hia/Hsf adhesin N-terminal domain-containing protein [Neisseria lactamica]|uniref:Hia/Hsf adhesin N-terminal domain-containing protein n=1 Tax=Neisseria lactamica TaxID=486 RepID=UPI000E581C4E|nr:Hia/Hsf adhesin N-terminal domain-containing protein [Neisseria lactamica]